jgi:hypothetical protein
MGGTVRGNPHAWEDRQRKRYLNLTKTVVGFWEADILGHLQRPEANGPDIGVLMPDIHAFHPVLSQPRNRSRFIQTQDPARRVAGLIQNQSAFQ